MSRFITLLILLSGYSTLFAQVPQDAAVPLHISTGINPPSVFLTWENSSPSDIVLQRRIKGGAGNSWEELLNVSETLLDGHFDLNVSGDEVYEYALKRKTGAVTAYGYGYANFFTPLKDFQGKILIFIDSTTADVLGADLITWKNDLRGEGWHTIPIKTGSATTVDWVKNQIVSAYNADPENVKAVLLIGEVPVPYSGSLARDGRSDHAGAWPCDAYYGDVDGVWTDNSVNITNTARQANRNVPGDGKFDQNTLPSAMELMVGRLDFRHLAQVTFNKPPVELLRRYFLKNHKYRNGQYQVDEKGLVDDNLGWFGGEAFAADGFRNAYPITGSGGVVNGDLLSQSSNQHFLFAFGAGNNGTYSSAGGIATSAQMGSANVNTVFTSLFGDYFGDWDYENNPLMPAFLASNGGVLSCIWSGRPHTFQHGLASGESIGYCLKETQNAQYNSAYGHFNGESGTHLALLGDPTLKAKIVSPVTNLVGNSNCNKVNLHWEAAQDSGTLGYIVYRSSAQDGPYERLTPDFTTDLFWDDLSPVPGTMFYAVRAMKLEVTPGGGVFFNTSTSPIVPVNFVPGTGPTAFGLGGTLTCDNPTHQLGTNFQPPTSNYQWFDPNGSPLNGSIATQAGVYTVVVTAPNGCTVAAYATVNIDTFLPELNYPDLVTLDCVNPSYTIEFPPAGPEIVYTINGDSLPPGTEKELFFSAFITVHSTSNGCTKSHTIQIDQDTDDPYIQILHDNLILDCNNASVHLTAISAGQGVAYNWTGPGMMSTQTELDVTSPGTYCCVVTGANGCTSSSCVTVTSGGTLFDLQISLNSDPCISGDKALMAQPMGGSGPYTYLWSNGETGQSSIYAAGFSGTALVTVTDNNNCSVGASFFIPAQLDALALTTKESAPGAADGLIDLLVSGGYAPLSFNWNNGAATEDISMLTSGIYTVTITDAQACTKVLTVPLITTSGLDELSQTIEVDIYPNPAHDRFYVSLEQLGKTEMVLELRDLSGKLLSRQTGNGSLFYFDTAELPSGLYLLTVSGEKMRRVYKVSVKK